MKFATIFILCCLEHAILLLVLDGHAVRLELVVDLKVQVSLSNQTTKFEIIYNYTLVGWRYLTKLTAFRVLGRHVKTP